MSNLAQIYSDATGKGPLSRKRLGELVGGIDSMGSGLRPVETVPQEQSITESELTAQNKIDWLSHPRTKELFNWIGEQIKTCQDSCLTIATQAHMKTLSYDVGQNLVMIQLRITTLKEILNKYATH